MSSERQKVFLILQRHAWNATAFQVLEPDFEYFFEGDDAVVAYVDTGRAWVAAGAPVCDAAAMPGMVTRFSAAARAAGRRAVFFAIENRLLEGSTLLSIPIGEQPWWDPQAWEAKKRASKGLREQLRRAKAKGVVIVPLDAGTLEARRIELDALIARWLSSRGMPPMAFLVALHPYDFPEARRYYIATRNAKIIGLLVAVPVFGRNGWFIEDLIRDPAAVNGTSELLVDAALRDFSAEGCSFATLGLAPLSGEVGSLRAVRRFAAGLYDFEGLRAFKARLRPDGWDPIYLGYPERHMALLAIYDTLAAFSGGRPIRFGLRALFRATPFTLRWLALLLVPWTILLAAADPRWFPSRGIHAAWVIFDVALAVLLLRISRRWHRRLAIGAGLAISLDVLLTSWQAAAFNVPHMRTPFDPLVILTSVTAPLITALVLWGGIRRRSKL